MAQLEDSFLAEIDELSDYEEEAGHDENVGNYERDIVTDMAKFETLKSDDDLDSVSTLHKTQRYVDIMRKVDEAALVKDSDDPEYKLIVDCNHLSVDIENEIATVHSFIRCKYRVRFPELESFVHHATEYASVVKQIGDEKDLTLVSLKGIEAKTVVSVLLTASSTKGKPLPEDTLRKTLEACDRVLDLDFALKKILGFVETKMGCIAPNLSAIVGSAVAAKLMATSGGLSGLAKIPSCNVQVLGQKRKNLDGFSRVSSLTRVGYLEQTEIFRKTPPGFEKHAIKLLAGKATLAARIDASGGDPSGTNGKALREEIQKKLEKLQEPGVARQPKPLPVPDLTPKKKRGGRRLRKMKERYAVTEMRKHANRVAFGVVAEESSLGDGLGVGYGMLGQGGSKRLRISSVPSKMKLSAKLEKKLKERQYTSGASTSTCGFMTSRLAFTPVQGIELCNPGAVQLGSGTQSTYFSESGTFSHVKKT
ncbi:unnamed protein product [Eruca vesicaria subsp. sativa]|uniref:Nop domain-containing protein n=1 Tax=Eruca vesicaria subsp. sativa TaxID=29727 RepID=A0ABC8K8J7_ERUVS|nr:unnamed protein product [Eruca vesicaria subsp. sativa]